MGLEELFSADTDAQQNGKWVPYGDGVEVLIAFAGDANDRYQTTLEKQTRQYRSWIDDDKMIKSKSMKEAIADSVIRTFAKAVVLDWKGVTLDGEVLEYSPKACFRVFKKLPAFFSSVRSFAGDIQNYQPPGEDTEGDEKNS